MNNNIFWKSSMNYPLIRIQEIAGNTPGTKGRRSGSRHALRFAIALLPMARQLPMSTRFKRLWTLGLLGAWLSIFSGNASAACEYMDYVPPKWVCWLPSVAITSPANGASYTLPASFPVTATVDNQGQPITQVAFYVNGVVFQTVTTAPYSVTYTPPAPGTYTFKAAATETNQGTRTGFSNLVSVTANVPPAVSITSPA